MDQIGKYRVVRVVGEGGMGRVYEATDPVINRRVAIKTVSQSVLLDHDARGRFLREAQAAGQLSHPNLITIFDVGEADGSPFIVMEYLEGEELSRLIAKGQLTLDAKLQLMIEVCRGLAYAHGRGLIHRDIKPANIFVTTAGQAKILDFGLARGAVSELTQTGRIVGTPSYMAPEQVRGEKVDHRSDIFAVGVLLYELVSGHKAFAGDSVAATIFQVLERQPHPLEQLDPHVPIAVSRIVDRAIAKDPGARYQRIDEMLADLSAARVDAQPTTFLTRPPTPYPGGETRVIASPGSGASRTAAAAPSPSSGSSAAAAPPPVARNWIPWTIAGVVTVTAIGGIFIIKRAPAPAPTTATAPVPATGAAPAAPVASAPPEQAPQPSTTQPATPPSPAAPSPTSEARQPERQADQATGRGRTGGAKREAPLPRSRETAPATEPRPAPPPPRATQPEPPAAAAPPHEVVVPPPERPTPPQLPVPETRIPAIGAPAAPTPPPSPAPAPLDPTAGLNETMARYKRALEARDLGALKQIWPTLAGRQELAIKNEFDNARSISVDLQNVSPVVSNNAATITCRRNYEVTTVDGRTLRTATKMTVTLNRRNASWVIDNIRHEAER